MRKVMCDRCGDTIHGDSEVRYLEISKLNEEKKFTPVMQALEICPSCCEKIRIKVMEAT